MRVAALIFALGILLVAVVPVRADGPGCVRVSRTVGSYTGQTYTPTYRDTAYTVAETIFVPTPVPYAFFQYVAQPSTPMPVTVSQSAYAAEQRRAAAAESEASGLTQALREINERLGRLEQGRGSSVRSDLPPRLRMPGEASSGVTERGWSIPSSMDLPPLPPREVTRQPQQAPALGQVVGIFQAKCVQCHSGSNPRGDIRLFNDAGAYDPNVTAEEIWAAVKKDRMPKTPGKLRPEEKALVKAWSEAQ